MQRGEHRDPHVDRGSTRRDELEAAVLRQAALGDVESRHHLHARGDGGGERRRVAGPPRQHAVDAQPDPERAVVRLDVDVAGASPDRLGKQRVTNRTTGASSSSLGWCDRRALLGQRRAEPGQRVGQIGCVAVQADDGVAYG